MTVMNNWQSGIRGYVLMVVLWVVGWALGFGGLIEAFVDPDGKVMDIWFTSMAIPGLIGGIIFSALLALIENGRKINQVALARMALLGAFTGFLIGVIAMARGIELTLTTSTIFAITIILGTVAAMGSSLFFRLASRWHDPAVAR